MPIQVARIDSSEGPQWAVHQGGRLAPIRADWPTTGSFLTEGGGEAARSASLEDPSQTDLHVDEVRLLSPLTRDGDLVCLGLNYASHLEEIGRKNDPPQQTVVFHKASSSLCGPQDDVVRPPNVRALDYEIELGLVVGTPITGPIDVTKADLHEYVGALVITNDISARDVQIACEQFCKGKSYRTFAPTGPFLVLLEPEEMERWHELELTLSVNDEVRQRGKAAEMIHDPAATLTELSRVRDFAPGDLIATGTPAGVALKAPSPLKAKLAALLSAERRGELVAKMASKDPSYLRPGDVITASIATADGAIDLGTQRNQVVDGGDVG